MRRPLRFVALGVVLAAGPGAAACGTDCSDSNCSGSDVSVYWSPGDVPEGAGLRICVDGSCKSVESFVVGGEGQHRAASVASGTSEDHVAVALEVLDADGSVTSRYEGEGTKRGECCHAAELRVDGDGLVDDPM